MTCEQAQEFFSDYLENSLDRPMATALELHLGDCSTCRRDLEGVQATAQALDEMPAVEPPHDLAWRVLLQLRQQRLERLEAERRRSPSLWDWFQSRRPAQVAMATALATLTIAGLLMWPRVPDVGVYGPTGVNGHVGGVSIDLDLGSLRLHPDGSRTAQLEIAPSQSVADGQVWIDGKRAATLEQGRVQVDVLLAVGRSSVAVFDLRLHSVASRFDQTYRCFVPTEPRALAASVVLPRRDYTLAEAVSTLAEQIGQPFIVAGPLDERMVELDLALPAVDAVSQLAHQFDLRWKLDAGGCHLYPG